MYRVTDAFTAFGVEYPATYEKADSGWTVHVISMTPPGGTEAREFYQVCQTVNGHTSIRKQTTEPHIVKRALPRGLFETRELQPKGTKL